MVQVIITEYLFNEIKKKFNKREANEIIDLMETLEKFPNKGKEIGAVGCVLIKELKYNKFRFYFICDGFKIKLLKAVELNDLIIKFVRMSEKKNQQQVIDKIKHVLKSLGEEGF